MSAPAQWLRHHHLLPLLALLSITWGPAPSSVKLLWGPVCPTTTSSNNNMGLCWTTPVCPGRNTISLGTPTGRGHGADGSHGASATSLCWTLQGRQWHQGSGPILPIHPNHGVLLAGVVPSLVKGHPSTGDTGTLSKMPRGKVSLAYFPRVQVQRQQTPTLMLSSLGPSQETGKAFP